MDTLAASAVARFQLKPMATTGTRATAKVPQPKAPSKATRSSYMRQNAEATTAVATVAVRAQRSSRFSDFPQIALGMSCTMAAAAMFKKPSAVDMIAAKSPAKTTPERIGWA